MKILIIILILLNSILINSKEKIIDIKKDVRYDELNEHPKFRKWIEFWKIKIPEAEHFFIEKTDTIKKKFSTKIDLNKWFSERKLREYTLDYSPEKNYVTDIYSHIGFEYKNDSVYVMGGDVDPSFVIINLKDSILYYHTFGPYAFFDESIWLTDSMCFILGFSFDDSRDNISEAYSKIIILSWDLKKDLLVVKSSHRLPYINELMNFQTYMDYLYPNFK